MKRAMMAAVAACLVAASASAQGPIQGQVTQAGCTNCGGGAAAADGPVVGGDYGPADKRYGLNPFLKRLMFWKKDTACGTCGVKGKLGGGCRNGNCAGQANAAAPPFNPYPDGVPGSLVFPYNSAVRSPRDWYMSDR